MQAQKAAPNSEREKQLVALLSVNNLHDDVMRMYWQRYQQNKELVDLLASGLALFKYLANEKSSNKMQQVQLEPSAQVQLALQNIATCEQANPTKSLLQAFRSNNTWYPWM